MSLLPATLSNTSLGQPFILLQSSAAQSCLPVLGYLIQHSAGSAATLLVCLLYPPSIFGVEDRAGSERVQVIDSTGDVPGYVDPAFDVKRRILDAVNAAPSGPLNVVIDSVDTLLSDLGSSARTETFLAELFKLVSSRESSRLVLHLLAPSPLLPILLQTRFSPSLTHLTAHPTVLLTHLATEYLTPPPPLSPTDKFWRVFLPIAERHYESERLVFGARGEGAGGAEFVVELLVRGADGSGRRRGVERVLEGWADAGPILLNRLESLKGLWTRKAAEEGGPDPTQNLSFNLNLTPEQQRSRAQVPLPYAHEGAQKTIVSAPAAILYDPDSADDLDDDDPDEDLDI